MQRMKKASGLMLVMACALVLGHPTVWARTRIHDAAESENYGRKFGGMLGRGLLNATTCFIDIIVNTVEETKNGPPFVGTLTGVAKGVGCGVLRLGSGAVDIVTFWVPGFNGIPVSDSYYNCLAGSSGQAEVSNEMSSKGVDWLDANPSGDSSAQGQVPSGSSGGKSSTSHTWKK